MKDAFRRELEKGNKNRLVLIRLCMGPYGIEISCLLCLRRQSRLFSHPGLILCGLFSLLLLFLVEQLSLFDVNLSRFIPILHRIATIRSIRYVRNYACMHSIMRLLFWRHAHAIETVRPVAHSVKSIRKKSLREGISMPSRYGRQAALHLIPSTSLTFSSSFGDNADILGGITFKMGGPVFYVCELLSSTIRQTAESSSSLQPIRARGFSGGGQLCNHPPSPTFQKAQRVYRERQQLESSSATNSSIHQCPHSEQLLLPVSVFPVFPPQHPSLPQPSTSRPV